MYGKCLRNNKLMSVLQYLSGLNLGIRKKLISSPSLTQFQILFNLPYSFHTQGRRLEVAMLPEGVGTSTFFGA